MKKLLFFLLALVISSLPYKVKAYQQTEAVCYSQCAAHKFYWKGDFCWDLFTNQCSIGSKDMVKNAISLVKDTAQAMATGKLMTIVDVSTVFKAMFVCKPLIEECITPQLNACENTCKNVSQTFYAPNLSVGNPYGSVAYHNIYYDESKQMLIFKVINNGGYAWDIDVSASWGHTRNRDKIVSGGGTLFTEKIPELLFFGARVGSPKTPGDYVTDFLIEESNFSGFLSRFKSDSDNYYIPPAWYKSIPFTAPEGEFTKVILNVDPNQMIPESSEGDNTYILEIDKLPTPVSLTIEKLSFRRTNPVSLNEYMVSFELKNSGEESGNTHVKWYEGKYESGKNPIYEQDMVIQGLNKANFDHILNVDLSQGGDSCNYFQKYSIVVFDDDGFIKTRYEFTIPKFAGSISGRVEDLFGKTVIGATITNSTGQTASTNASGYYNIRGIASLGKVTVTVTHPEFSKSESKEVEIKFDDSKDKCHIEGLSQGGVNFILKDQDVFFNVIIKDSSGNPVNAHVLASNIDWVFNQDVGGQAPMPGMQPGEYRFTISAPGYKTISQSVNAVPDDQNLEFTLEKLNGRLTDGGLSVHEPRLLWQMDRGSEILSEATASKDGKLIVLYTSQNKPDTGKLYFLNPLNGNQIKVISGTIATRGQSQACLDASYDGNTTAFYVHNGGFGMAQKTKNVVILFNKEGTEFGTIDFPSGGGVSNCDVSPDGFYIYPERLINKGLYVYTKQEILGFKDQIEDVGYSSNGVLHFTTADNIVAGCPKDGGECVQTIYKNIVTNLGNVDSLITGIDSSQNASKVGIITVKKAYLFSGSGKAWEKDIKIHGEKAGISVSPGGSFVIYFTVSDVDPYRTVKIFTDNNIDKTPAQIQNGKNEDVVFVHANDMGLFYLTQKGKTLKYYQVGSYSTEYNPGSNPTIIPQTNTSSLSYYQDGNFYPVGNINWASLEWGKIYLANQDMNLNLDANLGSITIHEGTLFALNDGDSPILLKGQMTANFNSPVTIYAIKFDRYDLNLFQTKLNEFRQGTLGESEYFIIKNIHTKFTMKNSENKFNIAVASGEVQVKGKNVTQTIKSGNQITIDKDNKASKSAYLGWFVYLIIVAVIMLILGVVLFSFRKNENVQKVLNFLKKVVTWKWKIIKTIILFVKKVILKILAIITSIKNNQKKKVEKK